MIQLPRPSRQSMNSNGPLESSRIIIIIENGKIFKMSKVRISKPLLFALWTLMCVRAKEIEIRPKREGFLHFQVIQGVGSLSYAVEPSSMVVVWREIQSESTS